jgi:hypothetical protein
MTATVIALALSLSAAQPEPAALDVKPNVKKGLKWLAEHQQEDGRWVGRADSLPTTTTALAGLALLMQGSTLKNGDYSPHIRKAVAWMEDNADEGGLLGGTHRTETNRRVPGHALALLFLCCTYEVDDDPDRRARLAKLIGRAVAYAGQVQTARGAWGFLPARDGVGTDDPLTTIEMLHALVAARRVGIDVPRKLTDRTTDYLAQLTAESGRIGAGTAQIYLTSGAAAALHREPGRRPAVFTHWLRHLQTVAVQPWPTRATTITMLAHLYTARLAFALGETGHAKLDPDVKGNDHIRWSTFRATVFPGIKDAQSPDGGWIDTIPGPVYGSAVALIILQLDNDYLSAFSR